MLIGIVFAVAQHTVTGDLRIVDVPTNCIPQAVTNIPNNLGVVIKAQKILDFESIIREILDINLSFIFPILIYCFQCYILNIFHLNNFLHILFHEFE